jgi:hypothetical protein
MGISKGVPPSTSKGVPPGAAKGVPPERGVPPRDRESGVPPVKE